MKLLPRFGMFLAKGAFGEIRRLRQSLEIGIDSYREVHGLPPKFREIEAPPEFKRGDRTYVPTGDLSYYLITELCSEQRVPFDHETDLIALAKDLGWMSPEGKLLLLPQAMGDQVDEEYLQAEGLRD